MLSLLKDFSFWKILPGERPVPLPPLSQLFFSVGVLFIYFSSFLILWYQFKSLYKCPRIQYKVGFFFFLRNVFSSASWLEDLHYIFFSFKYLSTSLLFFFVFFQKISMYGFSHQFVQKLLGLDRTHRDSDTPHKADKDWRRNVCGDVCKFSSSQRGQNINCLPVRG